LLSENDAIWPKSSPDSKIFRFFLSQHGYGVMQVDIQGKVDLFSAAWMPGYASGKSKKYRTFFRSMEYSLCKSETNKKSRNLQNKLWGSAPGIPI